MARKGCGGSSPPFRTITLETGSLFVKQRLSPASYWVLEIATLSLLCGCHSADPIESFNTVAMALERGDTAAALAGFTPDSAKVLRGLMSTDADHVVFPSAPLAVSTRAVSIATDTGSAPDETLVIVESAASPPEHAVVAMRLVDGEWRIDLVVTELQWNLNWKNSGGPTSGPPSWMERAPTSLE